MVAMSCEGAPPEIYLQDFQTWDARVGTCPLYSFLYHEYVNGFEGFYTNRVNDEALRLSAARALVTGYIVNFTLRDKGLIDYDWDQTMDPRHTGPGGDSRLGQEEQSFPSGSSPRLPGLRTHAAALDRQRCYGTRLRVGQGTLGAVRDLASA